jgi:hypothetical protein
MLPIEEEHFRHLLHVKNDAFPFLDPPVSPPATKRTPVSFGVLTALKPPLVALAMVALAKMMTPSSPSIGHSVLPLPWHWTHATGLP